MKYSEQFIQNAKILNILYMFRVALIPTFIIVLFLEFILVSIISEVYKAKLSLKFAINETSISIINTALLIEVGFIFLFLIFFNLSKPKIKTLEIPNSINPYIKKLKELLYSQNTNLLIHLNKTFVYKNNVLISLNDVNKLLSNNTNIVAFKLNHEIFHIKTLDPSVGRITKIFLIVITVLYAFIIEGFIENYIFNKIDNFGANNFFIILILLTICYSIIIYFSFNYIRIKECLCDRFAALQNSENIVMEFNTTNYNYFTHPFIGSRQLSIKGDLHMLLNLFIVNNLTFYVILLNNLSITNNVKYLLFISLLIEFLVIFFTLNLIKDTHFSKITYIKYFAVFTYFIFLLFLNYLIPENIEYFHTIIEHLTGFKTNDLTINSNYVTSMINLYLIVCILLLSKNLLTKKGAKEYVK